MTELEAITAETGTLTALLRHFDWSPTSKIPGLYEVWASEESRDDEILVPLDPSRGDYQALIERARKAIFVHYGRAARDLSAMLNMQDRAALESTRWKKDTSLEAGIIAWEDGENLYEAARSQLVASAKSTRQKRRYHGNSSAHIAKRFIENSFMGQTDVGSFIITAYTPAQERFHLSKHSEEVHVSNPREAETVYGSDILTTFERALKAIRSGLQDYKKRPRFEPFLEMVSDGVSYEFTKALSVITDGADSEISIIRQSGQSSREATTTVAFEAHESPVIARVATTLALDPEPQEVTLLGEVTLLSRAPGTPNRLIRLNIEQGADIRKARIKLSQEQYLMAMEAHRLEASVRVSGRLEKEGNLYWLYDAHNFSIVTGEGAGRPATRHRQGTIFEDV